MAINPYIAKMLAGEQPTVQDFMGPQSALGIMPGEWNPMGGMGAPQAAGGTGTLDKFLTSPGGGMLMNLLAQSGYSTTPQSPFGAIGKAALMTQQQQQQQGMSALQKEFIESQIGLNKAKADPASPINAASRNVQSQFVTEDGQLGFLRRDGTVEVTDYDVQDRFEIITNEDGSKFAIDRSNPGGGSIPVVTPQEAAAAATRQAQTQASLTLPAELQALDNIINQSDAVIAKIDRLIPKIGKAGVGVAVLGDAPYPFGGDYRTLKREAKSLQANFGFDTLQKMREASKTGGALGQVSERELELLINAMENIDPEGSPEVLAKNLTLVKKHYENYKREIEKMKAIMREQAGQPAPNELPDLSNMSDEELRRIANGG